MGIRWTEEEAINYGFRKTPDGQWIPPPGFSVRSSRSLPKPKPGILTQAKRPNANKKRNKKTDENHPRFKIVVTSYRKRDLDPDNLCPKWHIDAIIRSGVVPMVPDDKAKYIKSFEKRVIVDPKATEKTVFEIFELRPSGEVI